MATVPVWALLVVAAIGAVGAISASSLATRAANRREALQREHDAKMRLEERVRDDAARTFDRMTEAYLGFLSEVRASTARYYAWQEEVEFGHASPEAPDYALAPLDEALALVEVFGTPAALGAARRMYGVVADLTFRDKVTDPDNSIRKALLDQVRRDLRVSPDTPGSDTNT